MKPIRNFYFIFLVSASLVNFYHELRVTGRKILTWEDTHEMETTKIKNKINFKSDLTFILYRIQTHLFLYSEFVNNF